MRFLPLATIDTYVPEMERRGVSVVARGIGGFLEAYGLVA